MSKLSRGDYYSIGNDKDTDHRSHSSKERKRSIERKQDRKVHKRAQSSSSSTSCDEREFNKLLEKKRFEKIAKEKEEKNRFKELETPDEKRARRLAKKLQKEERRRADAVNVFPESIPYTDLNNPFNDNNLTDAFIWKKKWESEGKANISRKKAEKVNREVIAKNFAEMEQLKRNREAREAAKDDMEMIARDQERRQCDWNRTEDIFHFNQAKLRSIIRIKEGRAKPIDHLARYISSMDESNVVDLNFSELDNPLTYFPKDSIDDFEDLLADIKVYRMIDGPKHKSFWDDIETVAKNGLKKLTESRRRAADSSTVHSSVQEEVIKIFKGKTYDELEQLESQISAKISNANRGTDVSYWEALLDSLRPYMAKQRLKELHAKMGKLRLKRIREEQMNEMGGEEKIEEEKFEGNEEMMPTSSCNLRKIEAEKPMAIEEEIGQIPQGSRKLLFTVDEFLQAEDEQREQLYQQLESNRLMEYFSVTCYEHGRYSPTYANESQAMPGIEIFDESDDEKKIIEFRSKQQKRNKAEELTAKDHRMLQIAKQGMNQDEVEFSVEEKIEKQNFLWSDKYRPRKPRYFNRVHTGFDWNKYNQTHYDIDNPPPKIVQGYRFNIFFSDLLDPTNAPTFTLAKCDDPDFAILRFRAGPPYEDIAFKIVNREWEINYKHGYKCQFQNGIFQLWFFFKRYRYRR